MNTTTAIMPFIPKKHRWRETYIQAMWLMFLRTPHNPTPEVDGFYSLGEVGEAPEKAWTRLTPYSVARKEPRGNHREERQRILDV